MEFQNGGMKYSIVSRNAKGQLIFFLNLIVKSRKQKIATKKPRTPINILPSSIRIHSSLFRHPHSILFASLPYHEVKKGGGISRQIRKNLAGLELQRKDYPQKDRHFALHMIPQNYLGIPMNWY